MKAIHYTNQFKRDAKKHFLELLTPNWVEVLSCLIHDLPLDKKYHDHALTGYPIYEIVILNLILFYYIKKMKQVLLWFVLVLIVN